MKYSLLSKHRSELMGVAIISVMLFHASDLDFHISLINMLRGIGHGGVDIFVMLSAMGLYMSLERRSQEYGEFMRRRMRRLLPAYFAVMLPYTLYLFLKGRAVLSAFFWNSVLLNYWVRPAGTFNWYICGITLFYLVTPPLFKIYRNSRHPVLLTVLGSALGVAVCELLTYDGYWNHLDVFYRVPAYLTGLLMGRFITEDRDVEARHIPVWAACLVMGAAVAVMVLKVTVHYIPRCYIFVFTTAPACLIISFILEKLPFDWPRRALRIIGESSLEIYLLNVSLFAETELLRRFLDFDSGHYIYWLISFALNIALGLGLHRLIGLITGALRKKEPAKI